MKIRIVVAAHRPCRLPGGEIYVPMQVGAALHPDLGLARDDAGDNISERNPGFCELTGLYWMWRNADFDALGLAHYRRLFVRRGLGSKWSRLLERRDVERLLAGADALLPRKRRYWIETNYSQYAHAHHAADLDRTRQIIALRCPEYLAAFDAVMRRRSGHRFNMFIMRGELARRYCAWLFPILFELEWKLDVSAYSERDRRAFGAVAERLLDVWLEVQRPRCKDIPYAFMGRQNWPRKLWDFCARKLRGRDGA